MPGESLHETIETIRTGVNDWLERFATENGLRSLNDVAVVMSDPARPGRLRAADTTDGVHLSARGYERLGRALAERCRGLLDAGARVVLLGDSITEGYPACMYGAVDPAQTYAYWLEHELGWRTVNHGLCGDTTEGMSARLAELFTDASECPGPDAVLIQGGANDCLEALWHTAPAAIITEITANLREMHDRCTRRGVRTLIVPILPLGLD